MRGYGMIVSRFRPRHRRLVVSLGPLLLGLSGAVAEDRITYDDQVTPILRNNCFKCHNPDKTKAELDLTTYSAVLKGGGSGPAVVPGDPPGSKLYKAIARIEEPFMPDQGPPLADADIEVIRKWIAGGLPEKSSSQALAANKPRIGLLSNSGAQSKKPEGPEILPVEWRLEPAARTERTTAVTALAASPWSPLVAVGGQHQLLVYHGGTHELLGVLPFPEVNPSCVQFSRDSKLLVVGGGRGAKFGFVDVYEIASGQRITRVGNEFDTVLAADLNSDQTQVALGGPGKHVKIFSTRDAHLVHDLKKHTDWITAIQYSPDSVLLATGDRNGGLVVWEADSGQELYSLTGHTAAISAVSWRDDSEVLLSASEDGSIRVWEMKEGRQVATWTAHKDGVLDARFGHDTRIVSCGRDQQIALWDATGAKQRNWDAGGLPVRATFSHDGSNILASSWQGKVGVWLAADGKSLGEMTSNPPTLAERLDSANQEVARREDVAKKSEEALVAAEAEAKKIAAAMAAHDQSSPSFQFVAATRQARTAHLQAAEEAKKILEKLKAVATKSAGELAAAAGEAAKTQTNLDKTEKFSEPYRQLAKQLEAAGQKVATSTAKAAESAKALSDKTAAINAAALDLATRTTAAVQTRDQAAAALEETNQQAAEAVRLAAQGRAAVDQDQTRLVQQQTSVSNAMALLATAESEAARLAQALTGKDSAQSQELSHPLEAATKQVAEARLAQQNRQKTLGELKSAAEKSAALAAAKEAEAVKIKASVETGQKTLQTAKDALARLESNRTAAADAAKKETEALQASVAQANSALSAAKSENAEIQARLDKTEKFSSAFKEMTGRLDAASKQVAALRVPAEQDRKEVADLEAALAKITASVAAAEAEAAKALETMAKSDPAYQQYQELEKQLAAAHQKVGEAKSAADKTHREADAAKAVAAHIRVAQARMVLSEAREALAARQQSHEKLLATLAEAEAENARATNDLNEAKAALAAQPANLKALREDVQRTEKMLDSAQIALKKAGKTAARNPEAETTVPLLLEKQNALKTAADRVQTAKNLLRAAGPRLAQLTAQIKPLTESAKSAAAKLQTAGAAAAESTRQLAAEKDRIAKLAVEYLSSK